MVPVSPVLKEKLNSSTSTISFVTTMETAGDVIPDGSSTLTVVVPVLSATALRSNSLIVITLSILPV